MATSFAYALEDIPTHHLEECFRRAIRQQTDNFYLTAAAVNKAYQEMLPELQRQANAAAQNSQYLLTSGQEYSAGMNVATWKQLHNLPLEWRLGDAYPPESDLRGAPLPNTDHGIYRCWTCKDARWLARHRPQAGSEMIPCPACA